MPRDNAGHTGQTSRNPAGRGSDFPGEKKISTFYLTLDVQAQVKQLADHTGRSRNAFVEGLIRTYGPTYAADLTEGSNHEMADRPDRPEPTAALPGKGT